MKKKLKTSADRVHSVAHMLSKKCGVESHLAASILASDHTGKYPHLNVISVISKRLEKLLFSKDLDKSNKLKRANVGSNLSISGHDEHTTLKPLTYNELQ